MKKLKWNSANQLQELIIELVGWHSRTGTKGETEFPHKLKSKLLELDYFKENNTHIHLHDAKKERNALTALYHSGVTDKTIVLLSHHDTVHTEEFGDLRDLAFEPKMLTEKLKERMEQLPEDVQRDLKSDEYLFGRGIMDMKMGLALHMHLLELASVENWPINLLLLTVPDEEVNSDGMRTAVEKLVDLREKYDLQYTLFLNSEPSFSQWNKDDNHYIYSGTIGKIMPSALFYGKETHAGEPLSGLSSNFMGTYLTQAMEFNEDFIEKVYGEEAPLPICLQMNDLKQDYSVQTSHHSYALYNVFLMKRNAVEIMEIFKRTAEAAMAKCQKDYEEICHKKGVAPVGDIKVMEYEELVSYARAKLGAERLDALLDTAVDERSLDERQMSIQICDIMMQHCTELVPVTILFFAPPYYPAVNSSENALVEEKIRLTQKLFAEQFGMKAKQIHYFSGITDLSYVNYSTADHGWQTYKNNSPVWGKVYDIPFAAMQKLQAPIMNVGPYGKDAHKLTERLHKKSAFVYTPYVLREVITSMFSEVVSE